MHRQSPISVRVKSPSRGLVTALPEELADTWSRGDKERAFVVTENIRCRQGRVACAPGYSGVDIITPLLVDCLTYWPLNEKLGIRRDLRGTLTDLPEVDGEVSYSTGRFWLAASFLGDGRFLEGPSTLFDGFVNHGFTVLNWLKFSKPDVILTLDGINYHVTSTGPTRLTDELGNPLTDELGNELFTDDPPFIVTETAVTSGVAYVLSEDGVLYELLVSLEGGEPHLVIGNPVPGSPHSGVVWELPGFRLRRSVGTYIRSADGTQLYPVFVKLVDGNLVPWVGAPVSPSETLVFEVWNGTTWEGATSLSMTLDVWHLATVTHAAGTLSLYVDDNAVVTHTAATRANHRDGFFALSSEFNSNAFLSDHVVVWTRALTGGEISGIYAGGEDSVPFPFLGGPIELIHRANLTSNTPRPSFAGVPGNLYLLSPGYTAGRYKATLDLKFTGVFASTGYRWTAADYFDKVAFAQRDNEVQVWDGTGIRILPGLPSNSDKYDGVTSFANRLILWRDDLVTWSDEDDYALFIPVGSTAISGVFNITAFTQPSDYTTVGHITVTSSPVAATLVNGQYLRITVGTAENFYRVSGTPSATDIPVRLLDLTGKSAFGTVFAGGTQLFTLDANTAGQVRNVGAKINGPIYAIVPIGDYAYILKDRSFQTVQNVGQGSGVFYVAIAFSGEGLLGRYSWTTIGDNRIIFIGNKFIYEYSGGPSPTPICESVSPQVFQELDHTRLNEVIMHHRESRYEVWMQYPVKGGGHKVLVWNYQENNVVVDRYEVLMGFTAATSMDWSSDPSWNQFTNPWNTMTQTWAQLVGSGTTTESVLADEIGVMVIPSSLFNRDGRPYRAVCETMDYDFGDSDVWKYSDTVILNCSAEISDTVERRMFVQIGARDSTNGPIRWSTPKMVDVRGGTAGPPIKFNPNTSGRFMRVRIYSDDANVPWRVSGFELHCRAGGTY